ncbi:MAG: copper resistance protein B [Dokdonella sp.]
MKMLSMVVMGLLLATPLAAQTTATPDPHATHRATATKPKPKPASEATAPVDHSGHVMGDAKSADDMDHSKMDHGAMDHSTMDHAGMGHGDKAMGKTAPMEGMDHGKMDHAAMGHDNHPADKAKSMDGMDHASMNHAAMATDDMAGMDHDMSDMQGGSAPPDARDPDYSNGVPATPMHHSHVHGAGRLGSVVINNLEAFNGDGSHGQSLDMQAWYGGDIDKIWFKAEGERSDGHLGETRTELLWNRATAAYWSVQAGVRHDLGEGPSRNWAAFGVQGLAPYWFEVEATAYVGESGRTALRLEAEYELLLTQRLVLQPDVEVNFYGKDDRERGIGSGLSELEVGLRLRYEFTRKFAPYVGVNWSRSFGRTADFARAEGGGAEDTQLVAGVRLWF